MLAGQLSSDTLVQSEAASKAGWDGGALGCLTLALRGVLRSGRVAPRQELTLHGPAAYAWGIPTGQRESHDTR